MGGVANFCIMVLKESGGANNDTQEAFLFIYLIN
jgi:hypothetical protein